jgi:formyltetrahydrofolate synthetase
LNVLGTAICIVKSVGIPVVVAVNRFETDTDAELQFLAERAREMGAEDAVVSDVFARGSEGGKELAEAVVAAADRPSNMKLLYLTTYPLKTRFTLATRVYGAVDVGMPGQAQDQAADLGFSICPSAWPRPLVVLTIEQGRQSL